MSIRRVDAPGLFPDAPYHYAAVAGPGDLVFAAGACPLDESGDVVDGADIPAQTRRCVANLRTALEAAGAGFGDIDGRLHPPELPTPLGPRPPAR